MVILQTVVGALARYSSGRAAGSRASLTLRADQIAE
jgi:hypothetical protein